MNSLSFRRPWLGRRRLPWLIAVRRRRRFCWCRAAVRNRKHRLPRPPAATPVSVAVVEQRDVALWDEFSGRLEAVERVEVRSRVAGAVRGRALPRRRAGEGGRPPDHHRSGALCGRGRARRSAGRGRARRASRSPRASSSAAEQLSGLAHHLAARPRPARSTRSAKPRPTCAPRRRRCRPRKLNLDYTEVRAPVAGRVGKLEITVGNLVAAGPGRAGADHAGLGQSDLRELQCRRGGGDARAQGARRPGRVRPGRAHPGAHEHVATSNDTFEGQLQLIDNQVDARSGTVRVRAVFDNRRRQPDAGPVRAAAHGPGRRPSRRSWSTSARSAPTRTRSSSWWSTPTTRRPTAR